MKSEIRPIRFPDDLDAGIKQLMDKLGKDRSQIVRLTLLRAYPAHFRESLGAARMRELLSEYEDAPRGEP